MMDRWKCLETPSTYLTLCTSKMKYKYFNQDELQAPLLLLLMSRKLFCRLQNYHTQGKLHIIRRFVTDSLAFPLPFPNVAGCIHVLTKLEKQYGGIDSKPCLIS